MRRAVFIDALGTMLELEPPWDRIDPHLVEGIPAERVRGAFEAEIAYYRANLGEGSDPAGLAALRERCAAVLSAKLGRALTAAELMKAIRFQPYPDAGPALRALREMGLRLVCVSNWDCSLPGVLERVGLRDPLDGVVASAAAGVAKPDPAIFDPALAIAGCAPAEALHVGDGPEDVQAADAAGIAALRIDRSGEEGAGDHSVITSLAAISHHPALR